jgi:hypothetical protein
MRVRVLKGETIAAQFGIQFEFLKKGTQNSRGLNAERGEIVRNWLREQ